MCLWTECAKNVLERDHAKSRFSRRDLDVSCQDTTPANGAKPPRVRMSGGGGFFRKKIPSSPPLTSWTSMLPVWVHGSTTGLPCRTDMRRGYLIGPKRTPPLRHRPRHRVPFSQRLAGNPCPWLMAPQIQFTHRYARTCQNQGVLWHIHQNNRNAPTNGQHEASPRLMPLALARARSRSCWWL